MVPVGILTAAATSSFSFLLDLYPSAAAAYSLRKLRTAYSGSAIRVRRSSDNTDTDIGFVGDALDTTTLLTFVGVGNAKVITWYDQSGNGRNATNPNPSSNINFIVRTGVLQVINTKAAIDIPLLTIPAFTVIGDVSYFMLQRKINIGPGINVGSVVGLSLLFSNGGDNNIYFQRSNGTTGFYIGASDTTTGNQILNAFNSAGSMSMYKNNNIYTLNGSASFAIANSQISAIGNASQILSTGLGTELIIYTNSQLANRTAINTNINSYYSIY